MIKIAHRGNFKGKNVEQENTIDYLMIALRSGYEVEVDVWIDDINNFWLGHYGPEHRIDINFLQRDDVWCHAKDIETLYALRCDPKINCFWHDKDDFTFTSKGIKWARSNVITHDGIMVMPDDEDIIQQLLNKEICPLGICCDDFRYLD
jgi:hypothetical protein